MPSMLILARASAYVPSKSFLVQTIRGLALQPACPRFPVRVTTDHWPLTTGPSPQNARWREGRITGTAGGVLHAAFGQKPPPRL